MPAATMRQWIVIAATSLAFPAAHAESPPIARPATREATYAWLRQNDKKIIGMFPETFRSAIVPAMGGAFCSNDLADEWQAFVRLHASLIPGYERSLAQAVESIRLCAALKQASAASLIAAFHSHH